MNPSRSDVEDFLYHDAALLDEWRLEEWLGLFTPDATYCVPPLGRPDAKPSEDTFLVNDDRFRLEQRVASLQKRSAHAESPFSATRRLLSNVRIVGEHGDWLEVHANFCIYRYRNDARAQFVGQYRHALSSGRQRIALSTPGSRSGQSRAASGRRGKHLALSGQRQHPERGRRSWFASPTCRV